MLGLLVVVLGLLLVPLPGPGWLIVIFGIAIWSSEFDRAHRLLTWVRRRLHTWNVWVQSRSRGAKAAIAAGTLVAVAVGAWLVVRTFGLPVSVGEGAEGLLRLAGG